MIITRCPLRVSIIGGGTDLNLFTELFNGNTTTFAINKYVYMSLHEYIDEKVTRVRYSEIECVHKLAEIKHNIFRTVLSDYNLTGVEVSSMADIRSGSGLGSSSAFTNALVMACKKVRNKDLTQYDVATESSEIEINKLGYLIGRQDHFSTALGGIQNLEFDRNKVRSKSLKVTKENSRDFISNFALINTGKRPPRGEDKNHTIFRNLDDTKVKNLLTLAELSREYFQCLENHDYDVTFEVLQKAWDIKKKTHEELFNPAVQGVIDHLSNLGIKSFKLLGSGGGGFMLVYEKSNKLREKLKKDFKENFLEVELDYDGVKIIVNNSNQLERQL